MADAIAEAPPAPSTPAAPQPPAPVPVAPHAAEVGAPKEELIQPVQESVLPTEEQAAVAEAISDTAAIGAASDTPPSEALNTLAAGAGAEMSPSLEEGVPGLGKGDEEIIVENGKNRLADQGDASSQPAVNKVIDQQGNPASGPEAATESANQDGSTREEMPLHAVRDQISPAASTPVEPLLPTLPTEPQASAESPAMPPVEAGREAAPASPPSVQEAPQGNPLPPRPETSPASLTEQASAVEEPRSEKAPSIEEMKARLQTGINIGGIEIKTDANTDTATAFANGISSILRRNDGVLNPVVEAYIRYAVQTAQVAGVSTDQLRSSAAVHEFYPRVAEISADGKTIITPEHKGVSDSVLSLLRELGLPEQKPSSPQATVSESVREVAQQKRREAMAKIITDNREEAKLPAAAILPEADIRSAATEIIDEVKSGFSPDSKEAQVLDRILARCSVEDLASIVANPGRLASQKKAFEVANLIKDRIKYHPKVGGLTGKKWRELTPDQQDSVLAQEQFAALMANAEELKRIEKDYKSRQPFLAMLFKLLLFVFGSTAYQLVADEMGQISEGRVTQ